MGWQSEQVVALPAWAPGEGSMALVERVHAEIQARERSLSWGSKDPDEEGAPCCWWILSALERYDGKRAREAYYAGLIF